MQIFQYMTPPPAPRPKMEVDRRPALKIATTPQIVVCIPCGDKKVNTVLNCPCGCGKSYMVPGLRAQSLIPIHLMLSHMNLQVPLNATVSYLVDVGKPSPAARQIMTKRALELGPKYILYWDDDTIPPQLGLYAMYAWMEQHPEAGAITGVYTTRVDPQEPLIYKEHGKGCWWDFPMGPDAEPQQILGAGAGFLLARAEAVKQTMHNINDNGLKLDTEFEVPMWMDERVIDLTNQNPDIAEQTRRNLVWGHDVRFCKLLNENGWPVYVDGRVLCGHLDILSGRIYNMPDYALQRGMKIAAEMKAQKG